MLILVFFTIFFEFMSDTTVPIAILRAVNPEFKGLSMGLYWIIVKLFGYIPSPLIGGALIDGACTGLSFLTWLWPVYDLNRTRIWLEIWHFLSLERIMRRCWFLLVVWWWQNVFCYHVGPWVKFSELSDLGTIKLFSTQNFSAMITKAINIIFFLLAAYYFIPVPIDDAHKDNLRYITPTL